MDQEYSEQALRQGALRMAQLLPDNREARERMCRLAMQLKDWEESSDPPPKMSVVQR